MRRPRRPLRPEEADLWSEVAQTIRPLHKARPRKGTPAPVAKVETPRAALASSADRPLAVALSSRVPAEPLVRVTLQPPAGVVMDARAYTRMRKGRIAPESRIDLHGMTVAEAHSALIGFISRSHAAGLRLVLVITGKGKLGGDSDWGRPRGVLRNQVPHWLRLPPLGPRILQVAEAHASHGGDGALYVYLRKPG
jgi:DNA-nicking Smr family endonuclease